MMRTTMMKVIKSYLAAVTRLWSIGRQVRDYLSQAERCQQQHGHQLKHDDVTVNINFENCYDLMA